MRLLIFVDPFIVIVKAGKVLIYLFKCLNFVLRPEAEVADHQEIWKALPPNLFAALVRIAAPNTDW